MCILYAIFQSFEGHLILSVADNEIKQPILRTVYGLMSFTFLQVILGTRVREQIDVRTKDFPELGRSEWLRQEAVVLLHDIHRSTSWLFIISLVYLTLKMKKIESQFLQKNFIFLWVFTVLQIIFGVILSYGNMFAPFQVLHLVNVSLIVCSEVWMILTLSKRS